MVRDDGSVAEGVDCHSRCLGRRSRSGQPVKVTADTATGVAAGGGAGGAAGAAVTVMNTVPIVFAAPRHTYSKLSSPTKPGSGV